MTVKDLKKLIEGKDDNAIVCVGFATDETGEKYEFSSIVRSEDGEDHFINDYGLEEWGKILKLYI